MNVKKEFQDKVVVVTGGGSGIGRGIALGFAASGAKVVIADINAAVGKKVAREIAESRGTAMAVEMDVSNIESISLAVQSITDRYKRIDVLVNNAGIEQTIKSLVDLEEQEWRRILDVNLTGMFLCSKVVAPKMMERQQGKIINMSSINGRSPAPYCVAYNVSKAGIISLTQTLAYELAPYQINVNSVCPGPVYTQFTDKVMTQRSAMAGISKTEIEERIRQSIPLGRWGKPGDIASAVRFLASEDADWISGETLTVSGGLSGVSGSVGKKPQ